MMGNLIGLAIGLGLAAAILLAEWVGGSVHLMQKCDEETR